MRTRQPLTEEMLRILRATAEDRLRRDSGRGYDVSTFRWYIADTMDAKPGSRDRKLLHQRGYIDLWGGGKTDEGDDIAAVTRLGEEALKDIDAHNFALATLDGLG